MRIAVVVVVAVAAQLTGCNFNPPDNPGDGPVRCIASGGDCVCNLPEGICVECTIEDTRNCTADRPACGTDNLCRACRADSECDSNVCLEDGQCANPSNVYYVTPGGNANADCGTRGNECSLGQAMQLAGGPRNIIRLDPGTYNLAAADGLDVTKSLTLVARMSTFRRTSGTGPLVTVRPGVTFKLVGATLKGPNIDDGIQCGNARAEVHETTIEDISESGIEGDSCEFTVARSTLRGNLRGGINMIGDPKVALITNNFVYRNGQVGQSTIGGMVLKLASGSRVEFNTVVDNTVASSGGAGGIQCDGTYDARGNLIFRNQGGIGDMVQVFGTCTFTGSYFKPAATTDNTIGFKDPNNPTSPDFHLTEATPFGPIRDAFDCTDVDFELDPRPSGARCDHGADEHHSAQ